MICDLLWCVRNGIMYPKCINYALRPLRNVQIHWEIIREWVVLLHFDLIFGFNQFRLKFKSLKNHFWPTVMRFNILVGHRWILRDSYILPTWLKPKFWSKWNKNTHSRQISKCICTFLSGLMAWLIHYGHLILFLAHHSESQIMFEGFKGPLEVIEAEYQVKIKQKWPHASDFPKYLCISGLS